jgi:hypothetical protein
MRRRVSEVNEELAASQWRRMETLPVEIHEDLIATADPDEPPNERRVQGIVQHGELILRIPGVRVLERHPTEDRGSLYRIYADRQTGAALAIFMTCTGDDCTCDPAFTAQVMRFEPATFDWIDHRPGVYCEPMDFGFNDTQPWE